MFRVKEVSRQLSFEARAVLVLKHGRREREVKRPLSTHSASSVTVGRFRRIGF